VHSIFIGHLSLLVVDSLSGLVKTPDVDVPPWNLPALR